MAQASLTQAASSVLGVVNESANAVANLFTAVGGASSMLNSYVEDAKTKQRMSSLVTMSDYQTRIIEDKAFENAERSNAIHEKLEANPKLESEFNKHRERIEALFTTTN